MGFFGTFFHQLDGKNRIRIPAKFKNAMPKDEQLYFFKLRENCFIICPESWLNSTLSRYEQVDPLDADSDEIQDAVTHIYSMISDFEEDNQGRVTVPKLFRDAIGVTKENGDIVSIGRNSHIEVFSQKYYDEHIANKFVNQSKKTAGAKPSQEHE